MSNEASMAFTLEGGGFIGGDISVDSVDILNSPNFELKFKGDDFPPNLGVDLDAVIERITSFAKMQGKTPVKTV
jgi:hypothetical protein